MRKVWGCLKIPFVGREGVEWFIQHGVKYSPYFTDNVIVAEQTACTSFWVVTPTELQTPDGQSFLLEQCKKEHLVGLKWSTRELNYVSTVLIVHGEIAAQGRRVANRRVINPRPADLGSNPLRVSNLPLHVLANIAAAEQSSEHVVQWLHLHTADNGTSLVIPAVWIEMPAICDNPRDSIDHVTSVVHAPAGQERTYVFDVGPAPLCPSAAVVLRREELSVGPYSVRQYRRMTSMVTHIETATATVRRYAVRFGEGTPPTGRTLNVIASIPSHYHFIDERWVCDNIGANYITHEPGPVRYVQATNQNHNFRITGAVNLRMQVENNAPAEFTCYVFNPGSITCENLMLSSHDAAFAVGHEIAGPPPPPPGEAVAHAAAQRTAATPAVALPAPAAAQGTRPPPAASEIDLAGHMSVAVLERIETSSRGMHAWAQAWPTQRPRRGQSRSERKALAESRQPVLARDIRSFVDLCVFHPRHVQLFPQYAEQQYALTNLGWDHGATFHWGPVQHSTMDSLKESCLRPLDNVVRPTTFPSPGNTSPARTALRRPAPSAPPATVRSSLNSTQRTQASARELISFVEALNSPDHTPPARTTPRQQYGPSRSSNQEARARQIRGHGTQRAQAEDSLSLSNVTSAIVVPSGTRITRSGHLQRQDSPPGGTRQPLSPSPETEPPPPSVDSPTNGEISGPRRQGLPPGGAGQPRSASSRAEPPRPPVATREISPESLTRRRPGSNDLDHYERTLQVRLMACHDSYVPTAHLVLLSTSARHDTLRTICASVPSVGAAFMAMYRLLSDEGQDHTMEHNRTADDMAYVCPGWRFYFISPDRTSTMVSFAAFLCPSHLVQDNALGDKIMALRRNRGQAFSFALLEGCTVEPLYNLRGDPMSRVIMRPGSTRLIRLVSLDNVAASDRQTGVVSISSNWRRESTDMDMIQTFAARLPWQLTSSTEVGEV